MNDGKQLEAIVAFVEERMLPDGYDVKTNQRVYNDDGIQIAEFDVEIRGRLGSTDIAWLIECRDRPGAGPAPGSWIEQLVGRRSRFGFNKVTAVSTTGFAEGAQAFARGQGIELRVVESLTPEAFEWLQLAHITFTERHAALEHTSIFVHEDTSDELRIALRSIDGKTAFLRSTMTGDFHTMADAFLRAVEHQGLFDGVEPGAVGRKVNLRVNYVNDDDHFVVDTDRGAVRVETIVFRGQLTATETLIPVNSTSTYRRLESGELISQVATFAPHDIAGGPATLEIHRMREDGETYFVLRKEKGRA